MNDILHPKNDPLAARVFLLAVLFQIVRDIDKIAKHGTQPKVAVEYFAALFRFDSDNLITLFGDQIHYSDGYHTMIDILTETKKPHNKCLLRYAMQIMMRASHVIKRPDTLAAIRDALTDAKTHQLKFFDMTHNNTVHAIAAVYREHIGNKQPRITIFGDRTHLTDEAHVASIRALLLAAIRTALAWQQIGGKRYDFILRKTRMTRTAQAVLAVYNPSS